MCLLALLIASLLSSIGQELEGVLRVPDGEHANGSKTAELHRKMHSGAGFAGAGMAIRHTFYGGLGRVRFYRIRDKGHDRPGWWPESNVAFAAV